MEKVAAGWGLGPGHSSLGQALAAEAQVSRRALGDGLP